MNHPIPWCSEHGLRHHASVHEAGHAIAAVDFGIPISAVSVHDAPSTFEGARAGESASGSVRIDVSAVSALRASGAVLNHALFTFALAGESAEKVLLGHETPGGAAKDIREFWAWTKGQTFTSMEEYEEVLGEPFATARQGVLRWARDRAPVIRSLASTLDDRGSVPIADLVAIAAGG